MKDRSRSALLALPPRDIGLSTPGSNRSNCRRISFQTIYRIGVVGDQSRIVLPAKLRRQVKVEATKSTKQP